MRRLPDRGQIFVTRPDPGDVDRHRSVHRRAMCLSAAMLRLAAALPAQPPAIATVVIQPMTRNGPSASVEWRPARRRQMRTSA